MHAFANGIIHSIPYTVNQRDVKVVEGSVVITMVMVMVSGNYHEPEEPYGVILASAKAEITEGRNSPCFWRHFFMPSRHSSFYTAQWYSSIVKLYLNTLPSSPMDVFHEGRHTNYI